MTTSRWMCRSTSWMRPSMVALTVPSIAFSMGTNPRSTDPCATASSTAVMEPRDVQLGLGQVRLGQQRLLGESGGRAEVRDGFRRRGHSWAG